MNNIVSRWFDKFVGGDKIAELEMRSTQKTRESIKSIKTDIAQLKSLTDDLNNKDRQLVRAKKTWETTFNTVPDAIVIINGCGEIELMNTKAMEVFPSVCVGQSYTDNLISEFGCEMKDSVVWKAFASEAEQHKTAKAANGRMYSISGTPMEMKEDTWGIVLVSRDVTDMVEQSELLLTQNARLKKLSDTYINFTTDPVDNINKLTALCGELLEGACALYNRLQVNGKLSSWGTWNTPEDYEKVDDPEGHICYDIITHVDDDIKVIRNLSASKYAESDPNVCKYGLETYVGKAVKFNDEHVGSLCVVFSCDYEPSDVDEQIISVLSAAIGTEEKRLHAIEKLKKKDSFTKQLANNIPDMIWAKDLNGRYRFANDSIKENLLVSDDVEALGKTDMYFAERQREIGRELGEDRYHTFGELCINSDQVIIQSKRAGRFIEDGNVQGEYLCLDVVKAPLIDISGDMVGTVGCGRDVTAETLTRAELEKKARLMEGVIRVSKILAVTDSWDKAIDDTFETMMQSFGIERVSLFQNELIDDNLYCSCINEASSDNLGECSLDMQCVCYKTQAPAVYEYMSEKHILCDAGEGLDQYDDIIMSAGSASKCCVPVWARGSWWGFVLLETDKDKNWSYDEGEALTSMAEILAGFIFQREMFHNAKSKCKGDAKAILDEVKAS